MTVDTAQHQDVEVLPTKCKTQHFSCFTVSQLPFLCTRAVQLGSLYVRGLSHLLGANCASGCPLPSSALMPWHSFDGRLFHSKYLLAHGGAEHTVLLDGDVSGERKTKRANVCVCGKTLKRDCDYCCYFFFITHEKHFFKPHVILNLVYGTKLTCLLCGFLSVVLCEFVSPSERETYRGLQ